MNLGSIVLAGGRSRRMGQPKESLPFGDSTLLGHTVDTLTLCTFPVVVVARDPDQDLPPLPIETDVTFDLEPGAGPLAAIASGMRAVGPRADAVFVCSCDLPFLDATAVGWLLDQLGDHDLVVPQVDGVLQPLTAIYRCALLPRIDELLIGGATAPRELVAACGDRASVLPAAELTPGTRWLHNVNTPEDYQEALRQQPAG